MSQPSQPEGRKVLSREVSVFLVQLSIALHKKAAYPAGHPQLTSSVEALHLRLVALLEDRPAVSLGVARTQLVIEGAATDPNNPVLRELAQRLHRQQLGAIAFSKGIQPEELSDWLELVGVEGRKGSQPIGLLPPEQLQRWPHIQLYPLTFEQLQLAGNGESRSEQAEDRAAHLWQGLAAVALLQQQGGAGSPALGPAELASAINQQKREITYDQVIVDYLVQLGRELRLQEGSDPTGLQRRLSSLLAALEPDTLRRLLELGGDLAQRRQLVLDASHAMPVQTVIELLEAAGQASQQTISHSLLRILTKLAAHAESPTPVRTDAEVALRETVRQLIEGWTLDDPNPTSYTGVLADLARPAASPGARMEEASLEPARLVKMSLEVGTMGESTRRAVDQMVLGGHLSDLLALLDAAVGVEGTVETFWAHLTSPDSVQRLLMDEHGDPAARERVIARMGVTAVGSMLDALEVAESRTIRRRLLSRLSQFGPEIAPAVVSRLARLVPWFVQRNLLVLLTSVRAWPDDFSPAEYAVHTDARVRREALKLMLLMPVHREHAIATALADADDQIVRLGLGEAVRGCPPAALPRLMALLNDRERDPELRTFGIRVLAPLVTPAVRDWLLQRALGRRRWFGRRRLAAKSPELLAVLSVLAARWASDQTAAEVLRLADQSSDPEIRAAAGDEAMRSRP